MNLSVDLNADLGEGAANEEELLGLVTSANIACGFHAGDPTTMTASIWRRSEAGVAVGAHPSLADRENFGRTEVAGDARGSLCPGRLPARRVSSDREFVRRAAESRETARRALQHGGARSSSGRRGGARHPCGRSRAHSFRAGWKRARERRARRWACGWRAKFLPIAIISPTAGSSRAPGRTPCYTIHGSSRGARSAHAAGRKSCAVDGSDLAIRAETICVHGDTPDAVAFATQTARHTRQLRRSTVVAPRRPDDNGRRLTKI